MSTYQLDADYDRDGRVTGRAGEHDVRRTRPGAVLLANLDVDARALPATVREGTPVPVDAARPRKSATDREPSRIDVRRVDPAGGTCQLELVLDAVDGQRLAVWRDDNNRLTPTVTGGEHRYALPGPAAYRLEATDLAGAPPRVSGLTAAPTPARSPEVRVRLECTGPAGAQDEGLFTIAPLLFMDNGGRTERVYICEVDDARRSPAYLYENTPAVRDVSAALAQVRVPLVRVPAAVHGGDAWIQDQYQLGYLQGPSGWLHVLLHLPRARADASAGLREQNLAGLITSHFPARDIGVYNGFWERELEVRNAAGGISRIAFTDSDRVMALISRVFMVQRQLLALIRLLLTGPDTSALNQALDGAGADLWAARTGLPELLRRVEQTADQVATTPLWTRNAARLGQIRTLARTRVAEVVRDIPVQVAPAQVRLRLAPVGNRPARDIDVAQAEADRLARRLREMHSSQNYGGNIEVGPATPDAPLGKIVVGNTTTPDPAGGSHTDMDPQLLAFLRAQAHGRQPIVEIDTSWLDVGHIDEILAFVPTRRNRFGAAVLRASPEVATALLRTLRDRFRAGLSNLESSLYPDPYRYSTLPRRMNRGTNPVTHLMRGQEWLHEDGADQLIPVEPPWVYTELAKADGALAVGAHGVPLPHPPGREAFGPFPAGISVFEVLEFTDDTNTRLEDDQLTEMEQKLTTAFGNLPILRLPVLFDNLDRATQTTKAFTPDLANLQVVGDRLLVPRPFGPRTPPANAVAVLREVAGTMRDVDPAAFTVERLHARGLDRTTQWVRDSFLLGAGGDDAARLADAFLDGFPDGRPDRVRQAIIRANPGAFLPNGDLRPGWRRLTIPETTVDVFEAWTDAVATSLGLRVEWVDAWYYHVRLGSIHCGTNVIRRPADITSSPWWRLPPPVTQATPPGGR